MNPPNISARIVGDSPEIKTESQICPDIGVGTKCPQCGAQGRGTVNGLRYCNCGYTYTITEPKTEVATTGAVRNNLYPKLENFGFPIFPYRIDLVYNNTVAIRRLAYTYGEGALKYGDKNWMKGFEETVLLAHAFEHLRKHIEGDKSEDHLAHATWNLHTLMWVQENKPELMNLTGNPTSQKTKS